MGNPAKGGFIILLFGVLGFILALIEEMAYSNGYVLNMYLADVSQLPGLQIVTIVFGLLIGCVLAAVSS